MGAQTASRTTAARGVLVTLAASQFLMTLDSSVMNVSMATVAADLGTTITGVQTAITLYTLVMATTMLTGGKIGTIIGRRRAFALGCVIYGAGSLVTGLAPNLAVLLLGWSLLEGLGAALIMPAVVALVAANFTQRDRPRAYGTVAAAGAVAVAVGPLVGGAATTYLSWRVVFFAEVVVVALVLVLSRAVADVPGDRTARLDLVGTVLSVLGLGTAVLGVLRSSEWGWVAPKPGGPELLGLSPTFWCLVVGALVVWVFLRWEALLARRGGDPLVRLEMLTHPELTAGLLMFFLQFLLQAGIFFVVPLYLSVVLELPALDTGLRILPLSVTLLLAAAGIPRLWPQASPRRVVRVGVALLLLGILVLMSGIRLDSSAAVVAVPLSLVGLGVGALSSQLGAVTVSAVPVEQGGEVGGLQNTATNLGASLGTALAGSVLIAVLSATLAAGVQDNPDVPQAVRDRAGVELAAGVPFLSDTALEQALADADVAEATARAVVSENRAARVEGLDAALATLALVAVGALFATGRVPVTTGGGPVPGPAGRRRSTPAG